MSYLTDLKRDQQIESFLKNLESEDSLERINAILSLTELPVTPKSAKALCSLIADSDNGVRNILAEQLKQCDGIAIPFNLVRYVSHPELAVKNLAGEVLLGLGTLSVEPMLEYLSDGDDDDKKFIVDILGLIGDISAEDKIIELLNETENDNIILACVEALGNIKSEKSFSHLASFYSVNEVFKPTILEAMGKIGSQDSLDFLVEKYSEEEDELQKFAIIESLGLVGDEKTFFFLLYELNESSDILIGPILKSIYNLKVKFGFDIPFDERTKNHVLHIVSESDSEYRKIAARLLSIFDDKEILTAYLKIIGEDTETDEIILENFLSNYQVFLSLVAIILKEQPGNIVAVLKSFKEVVQLKQKEIREIINPLQLRDISDSLTSYFEDANEEVRLLSLEILFLLDRETAALFFDDASNDQSFWNRLRLIEMLDEVINLQTDEILKKLLNDPEEMIREKAEYSLFIRNAKVIEN